MGEKKRAQKRRQRVLCHCSPMTIYLLLPPKKKVLFSAGKLLSIHPMSAYIINHFFLFATPLPNKKKKTRVRSRHDRWEKHGRMYNIHNKEGPQALIICIAVMGFTCLYQTGICKIFSVASPYVITSIYNLSQTN